jgi:hypothetical protein
MTAPTVQDQRMTTDPRVEVECRPGQGAEPWTFHWLTDDARTAQPKGDAT